MNEDRKCIITAGSIDQGNIANGVEQAIGFIGPAMFMGDGSAGGDPGLESGRQSGCGIDR